MMINSLISIVTLSLLATISITTQKRLRSQNENAFLSPIDERLHYVGRFDRTNPLVPSFSWVMTGFKLTFKGSNQVYGTFMGPQDSSRLKIILNGEMLTDVYINGTAIFEYPLLPLNFITASKGLDNLNLLEVYKATEDTIGKADKAKFGLMKFYGFRIEKNGDFGPRPQSLKRKFEFIGDSDTAGWCANGIPGTGNNPPRDEDGYKSWSSLVSRSLAAEGMVEAISGYGVTTNSTPIQNVLDNVNPFFPGSIKWDYSRWVPDAVIMLIGPNDKAGEGFRAGYLDLLQRVSNNYKFIQRPLPIISVIGGSMNGLDVASDISRVNDKFNSMPDHPWITGYNVSITAVNWLLINLNSNYNGCAHHYNIHGHTILANDVTPQIESILLKEKNNQKILQVQ